MTATLVISRHVVQESVRRRVFLVVPVTLLSLGVFGSLFLTAVLAVFLTLGAIRGDAERGLLQPLVARPLGRRQLLLGRFVGATAVCTAYITVLYAAVVIIVHQTGGRWPGHLLGPLAALIAATTAWIAFERQDL